VKISLEGKNALITGATRGIGQAIANEFVESGAQVILTGTKPEQIQRLNQDNQNPNITWLAGDFSTLDGIESFLELLNSLEPIDICINNAGINIIKPIDQYSTEDYHRLMMINQAAPFFIIRKIIPEMALRGYGRIVNIASIWSQISKSGRSLYSTSKTSLIGLTRAMAVEFAPSGVLVNVLSPGFTSTELTKRSLNEVEMKMLEDQIPLKRFAQPADMAMIALFLCSEANKYITGQNIIADGGFTIV